MKILITGYAGFIGTQLVRVLTQQKIDVRGADIHGEASIDIRDKYWMEYVFESERPDIVIHLAALAGVRRGELHPEEYISTNIVGTKNVVDLCERYRVGHLVSFSSSSVYGADTETPLTEDSPKNPKSIYGMTKLMAEQIVNRALIPTTIVRPFTVYSDYGRKDQLLEKWIGMIQRGGNVSVFRADGDVFPKRGYTYLGDLLNGVIKVLTRKDLKEQPHATYNLGGDQKVSVQEIADIFQEVCNKLKIPYVAEYVKKPEVDPMCNFADTTKAKNELNWLPNTDFYAKVREILEKRLSVAK